jgi:aryl-alcohol dehydrogenase-like predicted oxidoreductase
MEFTTLGRTGLKVSVAALGCGGGSALGLKHGKSEAHSVDLVKKTIGLGVNFLDTANAYGTEAIVGKAIKGVSRDEVVISTKHHAAWSGKVYSAADVVAGLDNSLRRLGTDYIDVFHLHGVGPKNIDYGLTLVEPLLKEKEKGKFRFLGITESAPPDTKHTSLSKALDTDCFDVIMFAFSLMNHNAREILFPRTLDRNVGTMIMFVVRSLFSVPGRLQQDIQELVDNGQLPSWFAETDDPLGFLVHDGGATSVMDACYRYARHEKGADSILFGTGDMDHLETNLASILAPPLPAEDLAKIDEYFGHLEGVGLDFPGKK